MTTDERVAEILGEWRTRRDRGEQVDAEALIRTHPELADRLRSEFAAMHLLNAVAARAAVENVERRTRARAAGEQIGPYRLLSVLGRGGTSTVYLAQQEAPIKRRVALKFMDESLTHHQARARFDVEREALALMDHPNIAAVLDAGVTDDGHPYVVMEYVKGTDIVDYGNRGGLGLRDRLRLFTKVCDAVHHAHQKSVVHRDIKPANVLVTEVDGAPVPKVIDFGLAKPFGDPSAAAFRTAHGQVVGTPAYMSPEQARGHAVDARTDTYSLGMLLYEILTNDLPWGRDRTRDESVAVLLRRIVEDEPPKPSTVVTTSAAQQPEGRDPLPALGWATRLKGDLDWIVLKTLEKDPARRYASAQALAADVHRHLRHEPVEAGPPTARYRVRKFVRRHRAGVIASGLVLGALLGGLAVSLHQTQTALEARQDAERARREARNARNAAEGLVDYMLVDLRNGLKPLGRLDLLGDAAERARSYYEARSQDTTSAGERLGYARALRNVGEVLRARGDLDGALASYRVGIALCRRLTDEDPGDGPTRALLAACLTDVGRILQERGDSGAALASCREGRLVGERLIEDHPRNAAWRDAVAANLTLTAEIHLNEKLDPDTALGLLERAVALRSALAAEQPDDPHRAMQLTNSLTRIARVHRERGDYASALECGERVLRIRRRIAASDPDDATLQLSLSAALASMARTRRLQGEARAALGYRRESRTILERLATRDPLNAVYQRDLTATLEGIAILQGQGGDAAGALKTLLGAETWAQRAAAAGPSGGHAHHNLHVIRMRLALAYWARGQTDEALRLQRLGLAYCRAKVAANPRDDKADGALAQALVLLAQTLLTRREGAEAIRLLEEAYDTHERLTRAHPGSVALHGALASAVTLLHQAHADLSGAAPAACDERVDEVLARIDRLPGASPDVLSQAASLVEAQARSIHRRGDLRGATDRWADAVQRRAALVESDPRNATRRGELARSRVLAAAAYAELGELERADDQSRLAVEGLRQALADDPTTVLWASHLAAALGGRAVIARLRGDAPGERTSRQEQVATLERLASTAPADPRFKLRLQAARTALLALEVHLPPK